MFDQGYALIVGVGSYLAGELAPVPNIVADAHALAEALRNPRLCGMPESHVMLLHSAGATRQAILAAFAELVEMIGGEATIWIVYEGQGELDADGRYCLTTYDTQVVNGSIVPGSAIDQSELLDMMGRLRSRRVLLVLNVCHHVPMPPTLSAEAPRGGTNPPELLTTAVLGLGEGRVLITACRERQRSYIGDGEHTLFAQALLDGLHGPLPVTQGGYLGVFDLYDHVFRIVSQQVRDLYADQQEPEISLVRGTSPFAIAVRQDEDATSATFATEPHSHAVRLLSEEACRQALQLIRSGGVNFGQHNNVHVAGDVAGGTIDKRAGVFISGGTTQGTIVGVNYGQVHSDARPHDTSAVASTIEQALAQIKHLKRDAQRTGDDDLMDDLQGLALLLRAAAKAQAAGNMARLQEKIVEAQSVARRLTVFQPQAQLLAALSGYELADATSNETNSSGTSMVRGGPEGLEVADEPVINVWVENWMAEEPLIVGHTYALLFNASPPHTNVVARSSTIKPLISALPADQQELAMLVILESDDFTIDGDDQQTLLVLRSGRSIEPARFTIIPRHTGTCIVKALLIANNRVFQRLTIRFQVGEVPKALPTVAMHSSGLTLASALARDGRDKRKTLNVMIVKREAGYSIVVQGAGALRATLQLGETQLADLVAYARRQLTTIVHTEVNGELVYQQADPCVLRYLRHLAERV